MQKDSPRLSADFLAIFVYTPPVGCSGKDLKNNGVCRASIQK